MSLIDAGNLAGVPPTLTSDFQRRVYQAVILAASNVSSEVVSDVQTISTSGTVTGGTFTLTLPGISSGGPTAAIAFNATAITVQNALTALAGIGAGNVLCTGGPWPGTPIAINFQGALANTPLAAMTFVSSLTGGGTMSVVHTTPGVGYPSHASRATLATHILGNPSAYAALFMPAVANNATIQTDYPAPNYTLNVSSSQADNDIEFVVNSLYNAFLET